MTLQELKDTYLQEDYKFYKYRDRDGNNINTHFVFETHSDYLDKYLGFYKNLPNLTEVIVFASDGIFKLTNQGFDYFIRHNHQEVFIDKDGNQRGITIEISNQVRNNLIKRMNDLLKSRNFDEIVNIVTECKIKGFGELAIYDTSMRIASHLNIEPDKIYIHAGARKGMEILEEKGYVANGTSKKKTVAISEMPKEISKLKAAETEHFLCSQKDKMLDLSNK